MMAKFTFLWKETCLHPPSLVCLAEREVKMSPGSALGPLPWLKVPEASGPLAQRGRSACWPRQRSLGLQDLLQVCPKQAWNWVVWRRSLPTGRCIVLTSSDGMLRTSVSLLCSECNGPQMAVFHSTSSCSVDDMSQELTLVYITLPAVKLFSSSLVSLTVTEPMGEDLL